ncbi:hypothetical protein QTN47_20205 [Danxiaibacter flavus]|uniref:Uncharacterized protein n=1 Tax=Danxiaibacter flavus TaxID=3049108 RepID=A0ABV3ZIX2_9BACT
MKSTLTAKQNFTNGSFGFQEFVTAVNLYVTGSVIERACCC